MSTMTTSGLNAPSGARFLSGTSRGTRRRTRSSRLNAPSGAGCFLTKESEEWATLFFRS